MRLQVFSDLHIDVTPGFEPVLVPGIDAVVVAGDVCEGIGDGLAWLRARIPKSLPIVFVAGNHEFYRFERTVEIAAGMQAARRLGVTFLDDRVETIGRVRFVGATLWTDYELFGKEERDECMRLAGAIMHDHSLIKEDGLRFSPAHARGLHQQSRAFIVKALEATHDGPTVVVTHHGPHRKSVARRYATDKLTPAFVSDLSWIINKRQPALWVHGHTHVSFDYRVGQTRVVCNPLGYGTENMHFDGGLVIEV